MVVTKYGHVKGTIPGVDCCEAGHQMCIRDRGYLKARADGSFKPDKGVAKWRVIRG